MVSPAHKSRWKDEKRKPITVKGLLDNGGSVRLSPANNDDDDYSELTLMHTGSFQEFHYQVMN